MSGRVVRRGSRLGLLCGLLVGVVLGLTPGPARASGLNWSGALTVGASQIQDLTCTSVTLCTALSGSSTTTATSFEPTDPSNAQSGVVDAAGGPATMSCARGTCFAGDSTGNLVEFSPDGLTVDSVTQYGGGASIAVGCASLSLCWVTGNGVDAGSPGAIELDPAVPSADQSAGPLTPTPTALTCVTDSECVGVAGTDEVTLGSAGGTGQIGPEPVDAVSCPLEGLCVAVGAGGEETTFSPGDSPAPVPDTIDSGLQLRSVACPTDTDCFAVDAAGNVLEGNPRLQSAWTVTALDPGAQLVAISCPSDGECVATDGVNVYVGVTGTPPTQTPAGSGSGATGSGSGSPGTVGSTGTGSSTGASGSTGSQPTTAGKPSAGKAPTTSAPKLTVGRASVQKLTPVPTGLTVRLRCAGTKTARCTFILDLAAGIATGPAASRTVTLKPGVHTVRLTLVRAAQKLLVRDGELGGVLTVSQRRGMRTVVLTRRRLTLHAARR